VNVKFAQGLKDMMRALLKCRGVDDETVDRMIDGDLKEEPTKYLEGKSPRFAMQTLGTEWGRDRIGEDLWVNTFADNAAQHEHVVCTDVRFHNEAGKIHALGGKIARINRPSADDDDMHTSEQQIPFLDVDMEIENSSSLDFLELQVREFQDV
jgi:hypothetical protein